MTEKKPHVYKGKLRKIEKGETQERYALDYISVLKLLNTCSGLRDQTIVGLMVFSGLRLGEVQHLNGDWIDFKDRTITIPPVTPEKWYSKELEGKPREEYKVWRPKTAASHATLPILYWGGQDDVFYAILYAYFIKSDQKEIGLSAKSIYNHIAWTGERAGIKIHPHILRHTYKRMLLDLGFRIDDVMRLMRHTSIQTTDMYGKIRGEEFCKEILIKSKGGS